MKLCLVCSSGGHFLELCFLKELWQEYDRFWITFPHRDTQSVLKNEKKYWAYCPTNRNLKNFVKNLFLAYKLLRKEKPDVIISTGAGVAVPFILLGKLLKIKTIYLESITRINQVSLSGRLIYPFADKFLVQWPELVKKYIKAEYHGQVI